MKVGLEVGGEEGGGAGHNFKAYNLTQRPSSDLSN